MLMEHSRKRVINHFYLYTVEPLSPQKLGIVRSLE